jgi:hypothetical protein
MRNLRATMVHLRLLEGKRKGVILDDYAWLQTNGAEAGTRTPTGHRPLDPEPSASTSSATSAGAKRAVRVNPSWLFPMNKFINKIYGRQDSSAGLGSCDGLL